MELKEINKILKEKGLKVTPQRIAVMKVLMDNRNHPNADMVIKEVISENPYISVGTVYNILDTLVSNGIIEKIQSDDTVMRYDPVTLEHHHIFSEKSGEILDYYDDELTRLVRNHLKSKGELKDIEIKKIKINIIV